MTHPIDPQPLPDTAPLTWEEDIASRLVAGADAFLLRELERSVARRARHWQRDTSSPAAYTASIAPNRARLAHILGLRDERVPFDAPELVSTTTQPALVGHGEGFTAYAVRWPAVDDLHGEGLLLLPTQNTPLADVIALPDADQTPEQIAGLMTGVPAECQYARRLAESGCRVLTPTLIDRHPTINQIPQRELLYRSAYELGRHLIGYELQKVLAAVDWFEREAQEQGRPARIGVIGWGEGGMLALYAAAVDTRLAAACVSGYFDSRQTLWQQPIERNVFGLLEQFGDAELASLVAPRALIVEAAAGPERVIPAGTGGAAPSCLSTPALDSVQQEITRARALIAGLQSPPRLELVVSASDQAAGSGPYGSTIALTAFLDALAPNTALAPSGTAPLGAAPERPNAAFDPATRQARQAREIDRHNQWLLRKSPETRARFFADLDISSLERFQETIEPYRTFFYDEVIGRFEQDRLPMNPRTRRAYRGEGWTGYEVVLDVFPDVIAYGILLLPDDLRQGERRPVVVCQHGLEGRPQEVIQGDSPYYHDFAARLCQRGLITFAPQNLYIFQDRFRALQRKAYLLKKTLFSLIVPQHQQITDWLRSLPYVDPERIAFYGLSYGGKTAMRVPPLVSNYCLSICSADYNEWVWKNASTGNPYTYVTTGEYEIFEFDLGSTFNYAEMSWLICPRPFMVERGHHDGVAPDERVAYEYAKTKRHYDLLGLGDQTDMEVFTGPHCIHGVGTFEFLHKHLCWPEPE